MKHELSEKGFAVVENVFSDDEISGLLQSIASKDISSPAFRKSDDLFAIRQFFKVVPEACEIILNSHLVQIVQQNFGEDFFAVKSIYFDKPALSNWFVSYHQDLTISVDSRAEIEGFRFWTLKQDQFAVQPPIEYLEDNFTVRIHLDNTTRHNGALKVIPRSHLKGIYRPETINWDIEKEVDCEVPKGAVMFMKPLLFHSSGKTTNGEKRRVIHIELTRKTLPGKLNWAEFVPIANRY